MTSQESDVKFIASRSPSFDGEALKSFVKGDTEIAIRGRQISRGGRVALQFKY